MAIVQLTNSLPAFVCRSSKGRFYVGSAIFASRKLVARRDEFFFEIKETRENSKAKFTILRLHLQHPTHNDIALVPPPVYSSPGGG
jgi:hypothetical protein